MIEFQPFNDIQERVYRTYESGRRVMIGYVGRKPGMPFCGLVAFARFTDEEQKRCLQEIMRQRGKMPVSIPPVPPQETPSVQYQGGGTRKLILP